MSPANRSSFGDHEDDEMCLEIVLDPALIETSSGFRVLREHQRRTIEPDDGQSN